VLFDLARREGTFGDHLQLFAALGRAHPPILGRTLPLNGAGTCGAILADLGLPATVMRGVALLARCAGLLGHIAEEQTDPVGMDVYLHVDRNTDYHPPEPPVG
jgi:citrate synthase